MFHRLAGRYFAGLFVVALMAAALPPTWAQDQEPGNEQGDAGDADQQRRPAPATGNRPLDVERLLQTMEERMELSGQQWDDIDAIVHEYEQKMEEARNEAKNSLEDQREMMRNLMQERAEARQSGDEEREREIREKLRNLRPTDFRQQHEEELIKNITEVLDEEQVREFRSIVQSMRNPAMDPERVKKNPSLLRRAVMQLDLDQQQREELDEMFQNYWQDRREVSPSDREAMDNLALDFYDSVVELLNEEQRAQLESKMTGVGADAGMPTRAPGRGQDEGRPDPDEND